MSSGFWMYANGDAYYGVAIWRNGVELPQAIPAEWAALDAERRAILARAKVPVLWPAGE